MKRVGDGLLAGLLDSMAAMGNPLWETFDEAGDDWQQDAQMLSEAGLLT